MRRYPILPIIRSDPLVNLREPNSSSKKFRLKLVRIVSLIYAMLKKKKKLCVIQAREFFRFADVVVR